MTEEKSYITASCYFDLLAALSFHLPIYPFLSLSPSGGQVIAAPREGGIVLKKSLVFASGNRIMEVPQAHSQQWCWGRALCLGEGPVVLERLAAGLRFQAPVQG